jgi:hypothetical protein
MTYVFLSECAEQADGVADARGEMPCELDVAEVEQVLPVAGAAFRARLKNTLRMCARFVHYTV